MAQKIVLVDDIDGSEAEATLHFSVEGTNYEIDLSEKNLERFNDAVSVFIEAARVAHAAQSSKVRAPRAVSRRRTGVRTDVDPKAVRAWAAANRIEVSPRGRVARDVIDKFLAAGN